VLTSDQTFLPQEVNIPTPFVITEDALIQQNESPSNETAIERSVAEFNELKSTVDEEFNEDLKSGEETFLTINDYIEYADNGPSNTQETNGQAGDLIQRNNNLLGVHSTENNHYYNELAKMPGLTLSISPGQSIQPRELDTRIPSNAYYRGSTAYVRIGVRSGNGESNCENIQSQWRLNGLAAIGYTYALNAKTFISAELGYLRRSGNGLERSKDVDLQPLANVLISAYETTSEEELAIRRSLMNIRESLVAEKLDYLHLPVAIHVNLNTVSNVSIGAFVDRLVRVENESFMVYNSQDYIRADFGFNDETTAEGLNKWRVGLIAGYEQSITKHITIDGRAMLPITSVFDRNSEYYHHAEPNQLVDIQFGLNYKI
jgi:hypothetical protein